MKINEITQMYKFNFYISVTYDTQLKNYYY